MKEGGCVLGEAPIFSPALVLNRRGWHGSGFQVTRHSAEVGPQQAPGVLLRVFAQECFRELRDILFTVVCVCGQKSVYYFPNNFFPS